MWRLPDGTDLRLCRLAMLGAALVHSGQLLHSTCDLPQGQEEGGGLRLQLAVQPAMLQAWVVVQGEERALAPSASVHVGNGTAVAAAAGAGAAVSVDSMEFGSVQEAVLAVQRWAWQRSPQCWSSQRVCCTHLCGTALPVAGSAAQPSCAWLRCCQLEGKGQENVHTATRGLQGAGADQQEWAASHAAAVQALFPVWLQLGALFVE